MEEFVIYPAIDLRHGQVVRLVQGDPNRQTIYSSDPASQALDWLDKGASWLHVVNLDGAFEQPDNTNQVALAEILKNSQQYQARIQFGGGLRTMESIEHAFQMGVERVLLGTAAVSNPELVIKALNSFGPHHIGASLDARDGFVKIRGWQEDSNFSTTQLGTRLAEAGLTTVVFTDIARDGTSHGSNIAACIALQAATGLQVIASGGVHSLNDISQARQAGLAGVIIGRALYQGDFTLQEALRC